MDHRAVRAVGRIPVRVRTKLLAAFGITVVTFAVVGALGVRALGQANDRVEQLGVVQQRATAYRGLRTQVAQLRSLIALRSGGEDANVYVGGGAQSRPTQGRLAPIDTAIATTLSRGGSETTFATLAFKPPPDDAQVLTDIRHDYERFSEVMSRILRFDRAGETDQGLHVQSVRADPLLTDLANLTEDLVTSTNAETARLIADNRDAFAASRRLLVVAGLGSLGVAAGLGLLLSWALIGPIRRTEARVAEITAGDFSGRVEVANRDELGSLAANVNRMNDELERVYGELETVSRHKSEFLANMSHELRTPLNAIIGFSEVLEQQMFGPLNDQQLGYVTDVLDAGKHLLSLINDILDLAKVEAGRMELDLSEVSIPAILESGLTMNAERASRAGVALALEVDGDIVVPADERKVRQVVFNLLSNAIKFTPRGGRVDVSGRLVDGSVEVAVSDTGSGIAPADLELIFEEFQQARTGGAPQEGTGLGLPLSRRFIELHGGHLWVESEVGSGSTFRFTLPERSAVPA